MSYFIIEESNGDVNILHPVPPNHNLHSGKGVIVDAVPSFEDDEKLKFINNDLVVVKKDSTDLDNEKVEKLISDFHEIDQETSDTIKSGFTFNSLVFSLSLNAQLNWQSLFLLNQAGLYTDTEIATIDSGIFNLTSNDVNSFFVAYTNELKASLKTGRDKKELLKTPNK